MQVAGGKCSCRAKFEYFQRERERPINLGHLKICKGSQQALQPPVDLGDRKQKQDEKAWIIEREEKTKQAVSVAVCSALCTHTHTLNTITSLPVVGCQENSAP